MFVPHDDHYRTRYTSQWPHPCPYLSSPGVFWKCPQLGSCVSGGSVGPAALTAALWGHRAVKTPELAQTLITSSWLRRADDPSPCNQLLGGWVGMKFFRCVDTCCAKMGTDYSTRSGSPLIYSALHMRAISRPTPYQTVFITVVFQDLATHRSHQRTGHA
jgi:hypothetical protein